MGSVLRTRKKSATFAEVQTAAAVGEPWARNALAAEYLPRLTAFAAARGAAEPEGIANVCLLTVLRRLDELHFEAPEQLWAYLCQTARSRTIDEHRATKPVELLEDGGALTDLDHELAPFDDSVVEQDYVDGLLSPLTNEQREVLEMRFFDDLSIAETADRTGRSQDAVKGLQRRAINAILAAAAILAIVITVRSFGAADQSNRIVDDPAGQSETGDVPTPRTEDQGDGGGIDSGQSTTTESAADAFRVTVGSARTTDLDTSGPAGDEASHGTRVYCTVSHFSRGRAIGSFDVPDRDAVRLQWGNTDAGNEGGSSDISATGNSTCEGGIRDRSAYWMPAFFDDQGQLVLPESIDVEYKSFGGPGFDRNTVRPIPVGLHLQSHAEIAEAGDRFGSVTGDDQSVTIAITFPNCVALTDGGQPVLSTPDGSHLSHSTTADGTANNCPSSHPLRIPQLSYRLVYSQPVSSDWALSEAGPAGSERGLTAGFVSGWEPQSMDALVRCNIEMRQCEFAARDEAGRRIGRGQLPERFTNPAGATVYDRSGALIAAADRTPFGETIPQPG